VIIEEFDCLIKYWLKMDKEEWNSRYVKDLVKKYNFTFSAFLWDVMAMLEEVAKETLLQMIKSERYYTITCETRDYNSKTILHRKNERNMIYYLCGEIINWFSADIHH
jgi:hypothetical protein